MEMMCWLRHLRVTFAVTGRNGRIPNGMRNSCGDNAAYQAFHLYEMKRPFTAAHGVRHIAQVSSLRDFMLFEDNVPPVETGGYESAVPGGTKLKKRIRLASPSSQARFFASLRVTGKRVTASKILRFAQNDRWCSG